MKKLIPLSLLAFLFTIAGFSQNNLLRGIVTYQSSGSKPVQGVKVSSFGTNPTYSTNSGLFELTYSNKMAGDKVTLIVQKQNLEIVNISDLQEVFIRRDPDNLLRIVVCKAGERNKYALNYYDIIVNNVNSKYEKEVRKLNDKLDDISGNDAERQILVEKIQVLNGEKELLLAQAEEQAQQLANTDLDQASDLAKEAFEYFKEGNIEKALETMDDELMDKTLQIAREEKGKAENRLYEAEYAIQQSIDNYLTKARFCKADFKFEEAEKNYEKAIAADPDNYYNISSYANYLQNQRQYDKAIKNYQSLLLISDTKYRTASILFSLGSVYTSKMDFINALDSYENALEIRRELAEEDDYYKNSNNIPLLLGNMARLYMDLKQFDKAEELFQEVIQYFREKNLDSHLATNLNNFAIFYHEQAQLDRALETYQEALDILEELAKEDADSHTPQISRLKNNMGVLFLSQKKYKLALEYLEGALEIRREMASKNPQAYSPLVLETINNLPAVYIDTKEYSKALEYAEEFSMLAKQLAAKQPDAYKRDVGIGDLMIGKIHMKIKDYELALEYYKLGLIPIEELSQIYPDVYLPDLASFWNDLGELYVEREEYDLAINTFEKILQAENLLQKPNAPDYLKQKADAYSNIAKVHQKKNLHDLSAENYIKAIKIMRQAVAINEGGYSNGLTDRLNNLGSFYNTIQKFDLAIEAYNEAIEIRRLQLERDLLSDSDVGNALYDLGLVYLRMMKFEPKEKWRKEGIQKFDEAATFYAAETNNPSSGEWEARARDFSQKLKDDNYIEFQRMLGKTDAVVKQLNDIPKEKDQVELQQKLVSIYQKGFKANSLNPYTKTELSLSLGNLAWIELFAKQFAEAEKSARDGLDVDDTQIWINTNLAAAMLLQGRYKESEFIYLKLKNVAYDATGLLYGEIFLDDLNAFQEEGIYHQDFEKIRALLKTSR